MVLQIPEFTFEEFKAITISRLTEEKERRDMAVVIVALFGMNMVK
jgi:hypothetical protein